MTELAPWVAPAAKGWERRRIRTIGRTGSGSGFPPALQGQVDLDVPFYKVKHLGQANPEGVMGTAADTISYETAESLGATVFPAGTLVYAKVGAALMLGRVRILPVAACIDNNMAGLAPSGDVDHRFLYWAMSQVKFGYLVNPGAVPSLSDRNLLDFPLLIPPHAEQRAIADYLDRETARIDTLIEEQQRLIEMLHERRHSLVDGIFGGQTPNSRLQNACVDVVDCPHTTPEVSDDSEYEAVRTASVRDGKFRPGNGLPVDRATWEGRNAGGAPAVGDVLFTREAPAGEACMVPHDRVCLGQRMVLLRIDDTVCVGEFLLWQIYSDRVQDHFLLSANGSTVANVRLPVLRTTPIWLPELAEQRRIAAYLDEQTAKIDTLVAETERFIELARERRAALITAAVTGQIDVREMA